MSPVSTLFHTVVTVSNALKSAVSGLGTLIGIQERGLMRKQLFLNSKSEPFRDIHLEASGLPLNCYFTCKNRRSGMQPPNAGRNTHYMENHIL